MFLNAKHAVVFLPFNGFLMHNQIRAHNVDVFVDFFPTSAYFTTVTLSPAESENDDKNGTVILLYIKIIFLISH